MVLLDWLIEINYFCFTEIVEFDACGLIGGIIHNGFKPTDQPLYEPHKVRLGLGLGLRLGFGFGFGFGLGFRI
jgi:hypothetical protein